MKKHILFGLLVSFFFAAIVSCDKDPDPSEHLKPSASNLSSVSKRTQVSITLNRESPSVYNYDSYGFIFGSNSSLSDGRSYENDWGEVTIDGLIPNTTYYYKDFVQLDSYQVTSEVYSVQTLPTWVQLYSISDIKSNSVSLTLKMEDYKIANECGFYYSTSSNMADKNTVIVDRSPLLRNNYSSTISQLRPSTKYYCCAYIKGNGYEITSDISSFTTIAADLTYYGNKFISTQSDLDEFFETYSRVDGNLIIGTCYTSEPSSWRMSWYIDGVKYYFVNNYNISEFSPLSKLKNVSGVFGMSALQNLTNLDFLTSFQGTVFYLFSSDNITSLRGIENATNLNSLTVKYNYSLSNISNLSSNNKLSYLDCEDNIISSISAITSLPLLETAKFALNEISAIPSGINSLSRLTYLDLEGNSITSISPLYGNTTISNLRLHGNRISNISTLPSMTSLSIVTLSNNLISSITSLRGLNLSTLYLGYNSSETNTINDLSPLYNMTSLSYLYLNYLPITSAQVNYLQSLLPNCYIFSTGIKGVSSNGPSSIGITTNSTKESYDMYSRSRETFPVFP